MMRVLIHRHGPALWPEVFSLALLKARLRELGTALFHTVYQGVPMPEGGQLFDWTWFPTYATPPARLEVGQAWDMALKEGAEHDYSCGVTMGRGRDGKLYLLEVWRGQVGTPALMRQVRALAARWRPRWILMEDAGAGATLPALLRAERTLPPILLEKTGGKSKVVRAKVTLPVLEEGRVLVPERAPWLEEFRDELTAFPHGPHDDQVDAFVYLVSRFINQRHAPDPENWADIQRPEGW